MIPLEDVRKQLGNEEAKEQPSRSEKGDESGETIPPGVEREGVSFNNNPCFLPEGGVETGGKVSTASELLSIKNEVRN